MVNAISEVVGSIVIDNIASKLVRCFENFIEIPTYKTITLIVPINYINNSLKLIPQGFFILKNIYSIYDAKKTYIREQVTGKKHGFSK